MPRWNMKNVMKMTVRIEMHAQKRSAFSTDDSNTFLYFNLLLPVLVAFTKYPL